MKILSIGNSFSVDAHRYLHGIARANGDDFKTVNLYIGGCTLNRHYRNMLSDEAGYELVFNGGSTGFHISIKQALLSDEWDAVTLQQASPQSPNYETYQPYANEIAAYVRKCAPHAKIFVHETWAYEQGSVKLNNLGYNDCSDMYNDLHKAYKRMAFDIAADGIIPAGSLFCTIADKLEKLHRDTFHASLGAGRYALGLLWYKVFSGKDVSDNAFCDFDEEVKPEEIAVIKKAVNSII